MDKARDAGRPARLDWITRYRGFLISLVLLIHVGISYGAAGGWYFTEEHGVAWVKMAGTLVGALAQSFVLGAFFFVSAYFLPAQARRKGLGPLLADKLLRLGLPFLFYCFVLNGVTEGIAESLGRGRPWPRGWSLGSGPLWFVEALLIFTAAWILYARLRPAAIEDAPEAASGAAARPPAWAVFAYMGLAAVAGFAARLVFPVGWAVSNLQLGFFPMYIALFALGAAAGRRRALEGVETIRIGGWAAAAALLTLAFPAIIAAGGAGGVEPFLRYAEASFGVYQLHGPVIVLGAALMRSLPAHPAFKYLALALLGCLVPWALTEFLRLAKPLRRFL